MWGMNNRFINLSDMYLIYFSKHRQKWLNVEIKRRNWTSLKFITFNDNSDYFKLVFRL
jgi:hypothetical protein